MNKLSKLTKYQQINRIPIISKAFNSLNSSKTSTASRGFTIIELLIVIVIIGILVAITAVSYNGITKQAKESALKSELKRISTSLELHKAKNGTYPTSLATAIPPIANPTNANITYAPLNNGTSYSLTATDTSNPSISLVQTPTTTAQSASSPIQTVTKANCSTTRTMVRDARDNSTYWIQKLADGNCWMLTNLAYAGGGTNTYGDVINQGTGAPGTNTINGPDNSGSSTYTLAKYYVPTGANPTTEPTAPSTATDGGANTSTRQYGYLYNWCAAMGGQNTAACANATTPAPIPTTNICPAGWRLPTGEPTTGEFTALNTAINAGSASSDTGLLTNGLFQRSGYWNGSFYDQGFSGYYWSSTQGSATNAYYLYFLSTVVNPAYDDAKRIARAVRCVAE